MHPLKEQLTSSVAQLQAQAHHFEPAPYQRRMVLPMLMKEARCLGQTIANEQLFSTTE